MNYAKLFLSLTFLCLVISICNGKVIEAGNLGKEFSLANDYFKISVSRNGTINKIETPSGSDFMKSYHNFNIGAWGEKGICQRSDYSIISSSVKTVNDGKVLNYKIVCGKGKIDEAEIEINIRVNDAPVIFIEYHMRFKKNSSKPRMMNFNAILSSALLQKTILTIGGKSKVKIPALKGSEKINIATGRFEKLELTTKAYDGAFKFNNARTLHGIELFYANNEFILRILKSMENNNTEATIKFSIEINPKTEILSL